MEADLRYYVLRERAVPEVLLKVVEAKRLIDSGKALSIQEATEKVGISRSSFYKYREDIFLFHKKDQGKITTVVIQMDDIPGMFLDVLQAIAVYRINVLTIHQSISINGVANFMLSLEAALDSDPMSNIIEEIGAKEGVHYIKVIAKE
ncbi:MAG: ACT domain-containing protein [Lachnospiraceae bacterium]